MDDLKSRAKLEKLKELKRVLMELMAEEGGDMEMEQDDIDEVLEEADDAAMEEPEGAGEDLPIREASEEEMAEPEMSELDIMKREYFKPKMGGKAPGRAGAKTVIVAAQPMKQSLADKIPMPKKMKGKMA